MKQSTRLAALLMALCLLLGTQSALGEAAIEMPPAPQLSFSGATIRPAQDAVEGALAEMRETYFPLQDIVAEWIDARITPAPEGGYLVALPDFSDTKRGDIPVYAGEYPADYLPTLASGLIARVEALPVGQTVLVAEDGTAAGLQAAVTHALDAGEIWLTKLLSDTKAYQALTRMALDAGGSAAIWKEVSMADDAQRPRYSDEKLRKTLSGSWSGVRVREAEEALIAQGYLLGNVTGQYSETVAEAVRRFEAANDLEEDGKLDDLDLRVLYGEPLPWTLPQTFANMEDVDDTAVTLWWDTYLLCLANIRWEGAVLRFTDRSEGVDMFSVWDVVTDGYSDGSIPYESIESEMSVRALRMAASDPSMYTDVEVYLDLVALAEADFNNMFLEGGYDESIESPALDFCWAMNDELWDVQSYAADNPAPLPMPKTGAITRPPSGNAKLKFKNVLDIPVFLRIYSAEDEWDDSAENYLGSLFVQPNQTGSVSLRSGYVHLHYAEGATWFGEELMFGDEGEYSCIDANYLMRNDYEMTIWVDSSEDIDRDRAGFYWLDPDSF